MGKVLKIVLITLAIIALLAAIAVSLKVFVFKDIQLSIRRFQDSTIAATRATHMVTAPRNMSLVKLFI